MISEALEMLSSLLRALIYVLPAYITNAMPVIFVKLLGRTTPIDGGAYAWDGRRVLGDGKTWEGFISGTSIGIGAGVLIYLLGNLGEFRSPFEPLSLSLGAMLGDLLGSFIKRRLGLRRGDPAPGLDQLGFLLCALGLAFMAHGVPNWLNPLLFITLITITGALHLATNALAYLIGLKDRPY